MAVTVFRQDAAVVALVERWVALLAMRRYDEALGLLLPNAGWTAALLEKVIASSGLVEARSDGRISVVTPIAAATGEGPRAEVTWFQHAWGEVVGDVRFALPLDGAWSDVTALFDIVAVSEGVALALDDVHIL